MQQQKFSYSSEKKWFVAFALSLTFHSLLLTVSYGDYRQEDMTVREVVPIEVELGRYTEAVVNKSTPSAQSASVSSSETRHYNSQEMAAEDVKKPAATDSSVSVVTEGVPLKTAGDSGANGSGEAIATAEKSGVGNAREQGKSGAAGKLPYVIKSPPPVYPRDARLHGWEGTVRVRVLISESGTVKDTVVVASSGYESVDAAALNGLRRWLFSPAYKDGQPVAAWVVVPVIFDLES